LEEGVKAAEEADLMRKSCLSKFGSGKFLPGVSFAPDSVIPGEQNGKGKMERTGSFSGGRARLFASMSARTFKEITAAITVVIRMMTTRPESIPIGPSLALSESV